VLHQRIAHWREHMQIVECGMLFNGVVEPRFVCLQGWVNPVVVRVVRCCRTSADRKSGATIAAASAAVEVQRIDGLQWWSVDN